MTATTTDLLHEMAAENAALDAAHAEAARVALLQHARMGRPVCEGRDGKLVWVPPAEIFARYGLDEFGRPLPGSAP
jgi:hypothetical protein